jgi:superfamily II DNA or RNA helicase
VVRRTLGERPSVPLNQSDLLVNARGEPSVGYSLQREIPSADQIDLLCAFIKWNGLRVILPELQVHRAKGRPLRIITTTYIGATERRALDALEEIGADVKVSYETQSTRLHAKAWLLQRRSGFHTAYIGSSNLSRSALVDGLEWNVRLSAVTNSDILDKFAATFESYWQDPVFESYSAERDGERLSLALARAAGGPNKRDDFSGPIALFDIHPYPHQREILESLDVARKRHDRHRNLVVAATGTGKTIVAALDYRALSREAQGARPGAGRPSLLFVAHRKEILEQSLRTFRTVLRDGAFGELYVDGRRPDEWRHVFASVQSLSGVAHETIRPDHFDVVIVDEFHHAAARTYEKLLAHLQPKELLGLTATPERADGKSVLHQFGGRIAAELRLWEALDEQLLAPFQYFGIHDNVDLASIQWRRGGYDVAQLGKLYTGDDARARLVWQAVRDKVADPRAMRALGFCVSVSHAEFMADRFSRFGIPSRAVSADTRSEERADALRALRDGRVSALFAVDLFNEGVDVPEIDTVLFLRPTESATVFLQQLGRGLRHSPESGKSCLTVLDFIGQAHRHFRFDRRYRALTGTTRAGVKRAVEDGFPFLPAGCSMQLDRVARDVVLRNIEQSVASTRLRLTEELRSLGRDVTLPQFLQEADLDLDDLYRLRGSSWTELRRGAGLPTASAGPDDSRLALALGQILHWDDPSRLRCYRSWLSASTSPDCESFSESERRIAIALAFALWGTARKWSDLQSALSHLWKHDAYRAELAELLALLEERAPHLCEPLGSTIEGWTHPVPLAVHSRYSLAEALIAFDRMNLERPYQIREGVLYDPTTRTDLFFVTLEKTESHYSPTTRYRDYAISPVLFHWESQSQTPASSPTGQRYIHHAEQGSHVLLFIRQRQKDGQLNVPYFFAGPARYVKHSGSKPMAIVWELARPLPGDFHTEAKLAAG